MSQYQIPPSLQRSKIMSSIRSKDTKPEKTVRAMLRRLGYPGYRLHRRDLPGKPDIAFIGRKKAILVHGGFWHGHDCREGLRRPQARQEYWLTKISGNQVREERHQANLVSQGWSVLVVWECKTSDPGLPQRLAVFLRDGATEA